MSVAVAGRPIAAQHTHSIRMPWWAVPLLVESISVAGAVAALALVESAGVSVTAWVAAGVTAVMTISAVIVLAEIASSRPATRPFPPRGPLPPATAIIAAYLPNEQTVIVETLRHLLGLDYSGRLQVICAYNSPVSLPVEAELLELAREQPRLTVLRVAGSTSKSENVNAALDVATGDLIAILDADHHPQPGGFERAWGWLAAGYDVVQGRCQVRDGRRSALARVVAVEFDTMYAVTHPGRARVHGFAIFGGSNGYWRARTLRETRFDPGMLTEDIDASIRSLAAGARFAVDPEIVSTELAPHSASALWQQRLRWAQGWTQVARLRVPGALSSPAYSRRRRAGLRWMFQWCELLPWVSTIGMAVLCYDIARGDVGWTAAAASLALFNLAVGPVHGLAGRQRVPSADRRPASWYLLYGLVSALLLVELFNTAKRWGHLRELFGRRSWVVTPRPLPVAMQPDAMPAR